MSWADPRSGPTNIHVLNYKIAVWWAERGDLRSEVEGFLFLYGRCDDMTPPLRSWQHELQAHRLARMMEKWGGDAFFSPEICDWDLYQL
jgi:hypothetical protein